MTLVRFLCPGCSVPLKVAMDRTGPIKRCPRCGLKVPKPERSVASHEHGTVKTLQSSGVASLPGRVALEGGEPNRSIRSSRTLQLLGSLVTWKLPFRLQWCALALLWATWLAVSGWVEGKKDNYWATRRLVLAEPHLIYSILLFHIPLILVLAGSLFLVRNRSMPGCSALDRALYWAVVAATVVGCLGIVENWSWADWPWPAAPRQVRE
jgi:hypothetical protein